MSETFMSEAHDSADSMSFDEILVHLDVPRDSLVDLLVSGDKNFRAITDVPKDHRFTAAEIKQLEQFKEVLHLPLDSFTNEEVTEARLVLQHEGSLDFD